MLTGGFTCGPAALRRDLDRLQAGLGQAPGVRVGIATCEDPEPARGIAKACVAAMEPEDVVETPLANRETEAGHRLGHRPGGSDPPSSDGV